MPLSDHEKRALTRIEHELRLDSPHLASLLHAGNRRPGTAALVGLAMCGLVIGLIAVVGGVELDSGWGDLAGIVGYLMIVASVGIGRCVLRRVRARTGRRSGERSTAS